MTVGGGRRRSGSSAPITVLAALGLLFARKAVHAALLLAVVMLRLASLPRPGRAVPRRRADLRLHRRRDDAVPVRPHAGRRRLRRLAGRDDQGPAVVAVVLRPRPRRAARRRGRRGHARHRRRASTQANAERATSSGVADLIFGKYVCAFEVTSALLITAALGAMVLAHRERLDAEAHPARAGRAAVPRAGRQAPRPAAGPRRLRAAQRGRHPGAAAGRHPDASCRCRGSCSRPATRSATSDGLPTRRRAGRRAEIEEGTHAMNLVNYIYLSTILFSIGAAGVLCAATRSSCSWASS